MTAAITNDNNCKSLQQQFKGKKSGVKAVQIE